MRIIHILNRISYGDGVSNCVFMLSNLLEKSGYINIFLVLGADSRCRDDRIIIVGDISEFRFEKTDIILYHFYEGNVLNKAVADLPYKKVLIFQNVTPPYYFFQIDKDTFYSCLWGKYDIAFTAGRFMKSITMSEFSKKELVDAGWNPDDVEVSPLIDADISLDTKKEVQGKETVNILFTGRIAPNKKIEDVILAFDYYHNNFNKNANLVLVGSQPFPLYHQALLSLIEDKGITNVLFAGHVSNDKLEVYYKEADVFLCMSEHEGFCIPLLEAMGRDIPVIAYAASAVPDTMGEGGILLNTKNFEQIGKCIERLRFDYHYREKILKKQRERVKEFNIKKYNDVIFRVIKEVQESDCDYHVYKVKKLESYGETIRNQLKNNECIANLMPQFDKLSFVLYGFGKIGRQLMRDIELSHMVKNCVAICDNGINDNEYKGIPILRHGDCMRKFPNKNYIISSQNDYKNIIADLLRDGVDVTKIFVWDNIRKKLI